MLPGWDPQQPRPALPMPGVLGAHVHHPNTLRTPWPNPPHHPSSLLLAVGPGLSGGRSGGLPGVVHRAEPGVHERKHAAGGTERAVPLTVMTARLGCRQSACGMGYASCMLVLCHDRCGAHQYVAYAMPADVFPSICAFAFLDNLSLQAALLTTIFAPAVPYFCRTDQAVRRCDGGVPPQPVHAAAAGAVRRGHAARTNRLRAHTGGWMSCGCGCYWAWCGLTGHICRAVPWPWR